MSDKLTSCPLPPDDMPEDEAIIFTDIAIHLLHEQVLTADMLSDIEALARVEARRDQLIANLDLRSEPPGAGVEPITDYIHLADPYEFNKRFEFYISKFDTYQKAYEVVEFEYQLSFGEKKYSGYESFRVARSRRLNKDV